MGRFATPMVDAVMALPDLFTTKSKSQERSWSSAILSFGMLLSYTLPAPFFLFKNIELDCANRVNATQKRINNKQERIG